MYAKLIIIGNLGRDPETRFTPDGKQVTEFSLATSRKYKGKDETTWFKVTTWEKLAENCSNSLVKGSKVLVEGRLQPDANGGPKVWQKKDGTWGASYDVVADNVRFLSSKAEAEPESEDW